jgi:hypothetical protein
VLRLATHGGRRHKGRFSAAAGAEGAIGRPRRGGARRRMMRSRWSQAAPRSSKTPCVQVAASKHLPQADARVRHGDMGGSKQSTRGSKQAEQKIVVDIRYWQACKLKRDSIEPSSKAELLPRAVDRSSQLQVAYLARSDDEAASKALGSRTKSEHLLRVARRPRGHASHRSCLCWQSRIPLRDEARVQGVLFSSIAGSLHLECKNIKPPITCAATRVAISRRPHPLPLTNPPASQPRCRPSAAAAAAVP